MGKIINIKEAINLSKKLKSEDKTIVLAGGCFDILHIGHVKFLEEAKKQGDFLFILLESDKSISKLKGKNRPINQQQHRAEILESLESVDYIITIPTFEKNIQYDKLIMNLKPDTIAATKGDPFRTNKERQAKLVNAKIIDVVDLITNQSTTKLFKILSQDL